MENLRTKEDFQRLVDTANLDTQLGDLRYFILNYAKAPNEKVASPCRMLFDVMMEQIKVRSENHIEARIKLAKSESNPLEG